MSPTDARCTLEWLWYYHIMIPFLKEKIAKLQSEMAIRKQQGRCYDDLLMDIELHREWLQERIEGESRILGFLDEYADEDDKDILLRHFQQGQRYLEIGDALFYSERTITKKIKTALEKIAERSGDITKSSVLRFHKLT